MFFFCAFINDIFQSLQMTMIFRTIDIGLVFHAAKFSRYTYLYRFLSNKTPTFSAMGKAIHSLTTIQLLLHMHLQQIQQRSLRFDPNFCLSNINVFFKLPDMMLNKATSKILSSFFPSHADKQLHG
ncbi:hypothetical protein BLL41_06565 [Bacillus sp. FMQ74]|nr:hypothetical protein BLL41_06565 [Bacillus sp. FMQ74]